MSGFDLVREPWIRVRHRDGHVLEVSLLDVFSHAQDYRSLAGDLPIQDFAVLRILLAVLYRAVDREPAANPIGAWQGLWESDHLPMEPIESYLAEWCDRFDLFHPETPFLQVPDLRSGKGETRPVALLMPDGDDEGLFVMRRPDALRPAEAARWLITCHAYDPSGIKSGAVGDPRVKGGKGYPIGIGWAGWLGGITVTGANLRETLLLNLVLDREHHPDDRPIWEEEPLTAAPRRGVVIHGQVALLTWPQRRVRLVHQDGLVTSVLVCNGDPVPYTTLVRDELMTGWRYSEPQTKKAGGHPVYMPRGFDPRRAVWRGLQALLPVRETETGKLDAAQIAGVLQWSSTLSSRRVLPRDRLTTISTVGVVYGPQSASWDEVFTDHLSFDVRLAATESSVAKDCVFAAVGRADAGVRALAGLAGNLATASGGPKEPARDEAYVQGFGALDAPFRGWLRDFDPEGDTEDALQKWSDEVREIIQELGAERLSRAGSSAWIGRRTTDRQGKSISMTVGLADIWFRAELARELPRALPADSTENVGGVQ